MLKGTKHHPLYSVWRDMRKRCLTPSMRCYRWYGGRGITICKEWDSFRQFVKDMGPRPPKMSLDRIDNDGPYAAWNCRWATQKQQIRNSSSTRYITFNGETLCVIDWANRFGLTSSAVSQRIRKHGPQRAIEMGAKRP